MDSDRREQIRLTLQRMAETQAAMVDTLVQAQKLIEEEFLLDPVTYFQRTKAKTEARSKLQIEPRLLSVTFRGKTCFLGNNYPFHVLRHLAQKQNTYVTRQELFDAIWGGERSEEALRSTVKVLRKQLREAGLADLAKAIDGTEKGHYALKLSS